MTFGVVTSTPLKVGTEMDELSMFMANFDAANHVCRRGTGVSTAFGSLLCMKCGMARSIDFHISSLG